jgi:hypothetical protein
LFEGAAVCADRFLGFFFFALLFVVGGESSCCLFCAPRIELLIFALNDGRVQNVLESLDEGVFFFGREADFLVVDEGVVECCPDADVSGLFVFF